MARVEVNGQEAGTRIWPPYALDITGLLRQGANTLRVSVTNTPANRFFARKEDRDRAQAAGWFDGTYVKTYERFAADSLESGGAHQWEVSCAVRESSRLRRHSDGEGREARDDGEARAEGSASRVSSCARAEAG
jgi:hypothetical protein